MIDFNASEVARYFQVRLPELHLQGGEGRMPCPIHKGKNKNFAVNAQTGQSICHSDCGRGWDILSLEQELTGADFTRAKTEVFQIVGRVNGNGHHAICQPLADAPKAHKPAATIREKLERDGWAYHSHADFGDLLRQVRFEHGTKVQAAKGRPDKTFLWEHRIGDEWFSGTGGAKPPIYFNATAWGGGYGRLLLVEGWGKANAADVLAIAAASLKELSEANVEQVAGAKVVIWPDADGPGSKLAAKAAELLGNHGAEVFMITPPVELPEGGDIVDAIALGWDREQIEDVMNGAARVTPERPFGVGDVLPVREYSAAVIHYVVERLIAAGTVTVLSGDSGSGKTTVATAIAYAVARGLPFGGMATSRCPVIILDRENPLPVVVERAVRLRMVDGDGLTIWGGWCPAEPPGPLSAELLAWVAICDPKPFLIFDSLISYFDGQSENDSAEMRRYTQGFRKLADMGCTVLVLHHSGKGETTKDFRGSSDIKASIDTGWHLSNFGEGRLERLRLRAWKCRFAVAPDLLLTYTDGEFLSEESSPARSVNESLIHLLKANPGIRAADFELLARDKGLGRDRARKFLMDGVEAKRVDRQRGDHNSAFFSWVGTENE